MTKTNRRQSRASTFERRQKYYVNQSSAATSSLSRSSGLFHSSSSLIHAYVSHPLPASGIVRDLGLLSGYKLKLDVDGCRYINLSDSLPSEEPDSR